ncbi:MAG: hypothetical protein QOJ65_299 [Fimbriimonadaceae bacterium]|jgi:UPF0755 protein|nr:hypothetical protein [Fimbriimonadaceae bacterium]
MPKGEPFYVRFNDVTPLNTALDKLKADAVVRNPSAMATYAKIKRESRPVGIGTYQVHGGMTAEQIFKALHDPVEQMVRLPETNWAARSANILERKQVTAAEEYMDLVHRPQEFQKDVSFPLPSDSLEGYLYPDTYDLPPLLGARETILRQLKAFEKKVYEPLGKPSDLQRLLTIASMVELEVMKDPERPVVAGVIANRIKINMPLQIDASLLYGIQKWRPLTVADYRTIDSPYNTYTHKGLPPGPICSPTVKSVEAAMHPATHDYLYYVAMPGTGQHLFAPSYDGHLANIQKVRQARRALAVTAGAS